MKVRRTYGDLIVKANRREFYCPQRTLPRVPGFRTLGEEVPRSPFSRRCRCSSDPCCSQVLTLYGCSTAAPPPASGNLAHNKAALDTWFGVLNGKSVEALDSIIAPDYNRIASGGQSLTGVAALKTFATGLRTANPDLHITLDDALWANDTVYTMWTVTGTNTGPGQIPPTGKSVKIQGASREIYKDGKMVEERAFFDAADVNQQLGFTITPPAAAAPTKKK